MFFFTQLSFVLGSPGGPTDFEPKGCSDSVKDSGWIPVPTQKDVLLLVEPLITCHSLLFWANGVFFLHI